MKSSHGGVTMKVKTYKSKESTDKKEESTEEVHEHCGTEDCCGGCDTASTTPEELEEKLNTLNKEK